MTMRFLLNFCCTLSILFLLPITGYAQRPIPIEQKSLRIALGWQTYFVFDSPYEEIIRRPDFGTIRSWANSTTAIGNPSLQLGYHYPLNDRLSILAQGQMAHGKHDMLDLNQRFSQIADAPEDIVGERRLIQLHTGLMALFEVLPWRELSCKVGGGFGLTYRHYRYRNFLDLTIGFDPTTRFIGMQAADRSTGAYSFAYLLASQLSYPINERFRLDLQVNAQLMENQDSSVGIYLGVQYNLGEQANF